MRHNDDEQFEKLLTQMPKIKDVRERKEIYRNIQPELSRMPKRSKLVPSIALVAALLLFAIAAPMFMNQMNLNFGFGGSDTSFESHSYDKGEMNGADESDDADVTMETTRNAGEEESAADDSAEDGQFTAAEINQPGGKTFLVTSLDEATQMAVTVGVPALETDGDGPFIVPLTIILPKEKNLTYIEAFNYARGNIDYDRYGTIPPTINDGGEVSEGSGVPMIDVAGMNKGLSSVETIAFERELIESFRWRYTKLLIADNGSTTNVEIGNYVYNEPIQIETLSRRAYYKYMVGEIPLMVPSQNEYKTIGDTLQAMKSSPEQFDYSRVEPSIPTSITIDGVRVEDDVVIIRFDNSTVLEENEETIFALEAMMMVAKEFNMSGIKFESEQTGSIGNIILNEELHVPVAANLIPNNE